jgi:hypothetical protein
MNPIAFDFETEMIPGRTHTLSTGGKPINTSPWVAPRPVLCSFAGKYGAWCLTFKEACQAFLEYVNVGFNLVTHHGCGFDLDILYTHGDEATKDAVIFALDRGLIWDTKILDWLVRLADGRFDMPLYKNGKWQQLQPKVRGLATLAEEYCDMELDKDPSIRCNYAQFLGRTEDNLDCVPEDFIKYAEQDSIATLRVFNILHERALTHCPTPDPQCGPLSHHIQARAEFVAHLMDKQGVRVDQARARELHEMFSKDEAPLQEALVAHGLGEWTPVPKAERVTVDLPVETEDIPIWRKVR